MQKGRGPYWTVVIAGFLFAVIYTGQAQAQDLDGLFMETPDDPVAPTLGEGWRLSVSAGALSHTAVRISSRRYDESGMVLNLGVGRPVAANKVFEVCAVLYDLNPADFDPSVFQIKAQWRWYPGMRNPQKDQFYFQGGGTIVGADGYRGGNRFGFGISLDLGVDWFQSAARSYFLQIGFSALSMHGDEPNPPDFLPPLSASTATVLEPAPPGLMAQLVLGVRVGL